MHILPIPRDNGMVDGNRVRKQRELGKLGEQCRDVACYVWKLGKRGEKK